MLDFLLIIIIILAVLLMLLTYEYREPFTAIASSVFWIVAGLSSYDVDTIVYTFHDSTIGNFSSGTYSISEPTMAALFIILAIIMFISFVVLILQEFTKSFKTR